MVTRPNVDRSHIIDRLSENTLQHVMQTSLCHDSMQIEVNDVIVVSSARQSASIMYVLF